MSTRALCVLGVFLGVSGLLYGLGGLLPSDAATFLAWVSSWFAAAAWLRRDAPRHRVSLAYDWPWFMGVGWPLVWLWYARRTGRRWMVAVALTLFPFAIMVGAVCGMVVRIFVFGLA